MRTFLIVPLLLALGWSEQRLKIEWHSTDVAFFNKPYGADGASCIGVLESKRYGDALGAEAIRQGSDYATKIGANCERLIVSDGVRYKLFRRDGEGWVPTAHLNLLTIRRRHPLRSDQGGAVDVFKSLLPT